MSLFLTFQDENSLELLCEINFRIFNQLLPGGGGKRSNWGTPENGNRIVSLDQTVTVATSLWLWLIPDAFKKT